MKSIENLNSLEQIPLDKNMRSTMMSSLTNSNRIQSFNNGNSIYTIDVGPTFWNMEQLKKHHLK
ncbi:hypothetical protein ACQWTT_001082 [Acinetobacter baumannii]